METPVCLLERIHFSDSGTFGKLTFQYQTLFTGELPWKENRQSVSCIPQGEYLCTWSFSPRFQKYCYEVQDVPGRTGIRIHSASYMGDREKKMKSQVEGCIALGRELGWLGDQSIPDDRRQQYLMDSASATRYFESVMKQKVFRLFIVNRLPPART